MFCHLSALAGLVIPFGNLIGPLIIWQVKKNELPRVDEHGKESFNFQLSAWIYLLVGGVMAFVGAFFCIGWLLVPVLLLIHFGALILAIVGGVKANDGVTYRYPFNLRLIK